MLEGIFIKLAILFGGVIISFIFGYFKGKNNEKVKQLKANVKDAIKTKKRRKKRSSDNMATVKRRMRKYTIG